MLSNLRQTVRHVMAEGLIPVLFYLRRRYPIVIEYPFEN